MTLAYACVLIGGLMPLLWTATAKFGGRRKMSFAENAGPRDFLANTTGLQKRADWAQQNAFEAFPLFAAAVIVAHLSGAAQARIDLLAMLWVGFRLAYGLCYLADWATARSLTWTAALACAVALFCAA
jgi:uncharacterized MAPEG superfamily protein